MTRHQARMFFLILVLLTGFGAGGRAVNEALNGVPVNSLFVTKYLVVMGLAIFWEALILAVIRTAFIILYDEEKKARRHPYRGKVRLVRTRG